MKVQNAQGQPLAGARGEIDRKDGLNPVTLVMDSNGETTVNDPSLYVAATVFKFSAPGYMVSYYTGDQMGPDSVITMDKETVNMGSVLLVGAGLIVAYYFLRKKL